MAAPVRVAVLGGTGRWGHKILKTLELIPDEAVAVAAVGSADVDGRAAWQRIIDAKNTMQIEAIIIATPPSVHSIQAVTALEARLPIFIEKPLALSSDEAQHIAAAAKDIPILVDHQHLFHSAYSELKRRLVEPIVAVDSIGCGSGPYRSDCGAMWDYGPHDIAYAVDLLGSPEAIRRDTLAAEAGGQNWVLVLEYPTARARCCFGNGFLTKYRQLTVWTASGDSFRLNDRNLHPLTYNGDTVEVADRTLPVMAALRVFLKAVRGQLDPRLGVDLAVEVVKILEQAEGIT